MGEIHHSGRIGSRRANLSHWLWFLLADFFCFQIRNVLLSYHPVPSFYTNGRLPPDNQLTSVNNILSCSNSPYSHICPEDSIPQLLSAFLLFSLQYCRYNLFHVIKAVIIQNAHSESLVNNLHDGFCIRFYPHTSDY